MESNHVDWVKVYWNKNFYERCKEVCPIRVYGTTPIGSNKFIDLTKGYEELESGSIMIKTKKELPIIYSKVYMVIPREFKEVFTDLKYYCEHGVSLKPWDWYDEDHFWYEF